MPILWRYILRGYVKIFSLSVFTFIAVLLVARFKEIARFTALSGDWSKTALFVSYQIPLILPIAIPISALIASLLLMQKLSQTFELTALRASGVSILNAIAPILTCSLFLSILNFSFAAEISPFCRRESKTLLYRETSANPLLLLQRQHLVKVKHAYINMQIKDEGNMVKNLILIAHNESNQRLTLVAARQLKIEGDKLLGSDVAIVSHLHSENAKGFDPLIIENQSSMSTAAPVLSAALKKNRPKIDANALGLRMLRLRAAEVGKKGKGAIVEILRRINLTLAVFSFTFLGSVFGIEHGRSPSKKNLFSALGFTLVVLVSYFLGKELKSQTPLAFCALLVPHGAIWLACIGKLRAVARGSV